MTSSTAPGPEQGPGHPAAPGDAPRGRAEDAAQALASFPPVVYAPTVAGDDGVVRLELLRLADGRTALFVYSAIDRLHTWWRGDAPWVLMSVADLQRAHDDVPYDLLLLDRHPSRVRDGDDATPD